MVRKLLLALGLLVACQLVTGYPYATTARMWHVDSRTYSHHLAGQCQHCQKVESKPACLHCQPAPEQHDCECQWSGAPEQPDLVYAGSLQPVSYAVALSSTQVHWMNPKVKLLRSLVVASRLGLPPPPIPLRVNALRGPPLAA